MGSSAAAFTGIVMSTAAAASLAAQTSAATVTVTNVGSASSVATGIWSPPQWNKTLTYLLTPTIPATTQNSSNAASADIINSPTIKQSVNAANYVFDAVLKVRAISHLEITAHPIQTGANISDHAYMQPRRIMLDVAMSDAQAAAPSGASNSGPGQTKQYTPWSGSASKSVSAYLTLKNIQQNRYFCALTTKYDSYKYLLLEDITSTEDNKTVNGYRGTLTFREVFTAYVQTTGVSARQNATDDTPLSTVNTQAPNSAQSNNFTVNDYPPLTTVPGSGTVSSNGSASGGVVGSFFSAPLSF